jgi:hypothetical protein
VNERHDVAKKVNPFSAARVRPGRTPYRFPKGQTAGKLIERFQQNGWWGQIVGPHGSGKSALLAELIPLIEQAGRTTFRIELHDGQRRLPVNLRREIDLASKPVVIVDGYEQLSRWARFRLRRFCRRHRIGLLITAHVSMGFADVARTATGLSQIGEIVEQLVGSDPFKITSAEIAGRFAAREGNIRELLFDLYDVYEERRWRSDAGNGGSGASADRGRGLEL